MRENELQKVNAALEALASVKTSKEYTAAKRLAKKCSPVNQLALVDSLIAARRRSMEVV